MRGLHMRLVIDLRLVKRDLDEALVKLAVESILRKHLPQYVEMESVKEPEQAHDIQKAVIQYLEGAIAFAELILVLSVHYAEAQQANMDQCMSCGRPLEVPR